MRCSNLKTITKKTTKDKILDLLKREVALTVSDLTQCLNITDMAVRKHLTTMEQDGIIKSKEVKQPVGRPLQIYSLSEKGEMLFPKNYEGLSIEFLRDIQEMYGEQTIVQLFKKREQRMTKEYIRRFQNKTPFEKMIELHNIQNEKGYMAAVSQIDEKTFELTEYNCPILKIAHEYKAACSCETSMFKHVLDTDNITRTSCKSEGNDHCKFLISF
ncbi:DeoR family transcriptional regulator [Bacillus ginsengihumi]|uniref:DeoR faimly transcriptional regulator n=1 Tax=Heyndrickxia ginsengihumi TaxID=363870 RepID=A0A0A6VI06_9BACI|nr:DeoR faimly transcriptional regulator [Heyndrickxia ginsengihumi]MBE6185348.1 DeoR family transcriptional regulator [Bacillus sp. (in: firmicutes)]NEY20209.1 DeoR family transcriptional regulator [Heyndrickxia ginsengihumi]